MPFPIPAGTRRRVAIHAATPWLCVALLAALPQAFAAPGELPFAEAVRLASERAVLLDARRAALESARQEARRAGALPDPVLTVGVSNLPVTGSDAFATQVDPMTMQRIGLRQAIPAGAKRDAQRVLAARRIDEARAGLEAERLAVRRAAAEAWIDLWASQRELLALRGLREQAQLASRLAHARLRSGAGQAVDALAAEAAVLELDNRIAEAEAGQIEAQAGLQRWIGEGAVAVAGAPDFTVVPFSEAQLLAALDRLPALEPIDARLETAAATVDAARAERRPDWSVAASYGRRGAARSDMLMLEVGVGLPLFARNRQDRGIAAREADYREALATREDRRREQEARIRADFARWEGIRHVVNLHVQAQIPLAHDRSATALAAYRAGAGLQPWLDARRDELDLHVAHARHLNRLGRAWAALAFLLEESQ
ncbi:TolC family protein [Luteimonas sp. SJ-92]|uniref:TolC family protein n=1 Tax=Luteimonas salinisoli TaxID=2752307 RepID=A0A853J7X3_9GAMM|nr:TolC family protein [Luteimonas salinisoli]NZA24828.1 TolC family protein [Luteimonas salinisoli]